jgi:predicted nucleotidyltransferase
MRLSAFELAEIKKTFQRFSFKDTKIYLFGSRLDDTKKGGDIDLLISFSDKSDLPNFRRLDFLVELKKQIGDRKIDVTLGLAEETQTDPFLESIFSSAVEI